MFINKFGGFHPPYPLFHVRNPGNGASEASPNRGYHSEGLPVSKYIFYSRNHIL